MVKAFAARAADLRLIPVFAVDFFFFFSRSSHTSDLNIRNPVATLSGVVRSTLGPVGPVSVY